MTGIKNANTLDINNYGNQSSAVRFDTHVDEASRQFLIDDLAQVSLDYFNAVNDQRNGVAGAGERVIELAGRITELKAFLSPSEITAAQAKSRQLRDQQGNR